MAICGKSHDFDKKQDCVSSSYPLRALGDTPAREQKGLVYTGFKKETAVGIRYSAPRRIPRANWVFGKEHY
jgi:hypothetical protein